MKVINDQGWGYTSTLIYAIEWLLQNQKKYKIEVANLSLGHPPTESYQNDPLCAAVRKLVAADIGTVVSGGNLGKTSSYPKIWDAITSPGIEPSVIKVSPINTQGTLTHVDDTATSYGSRGPTLDGQFKPDLCAPGNAIASVLAEASWLEQNLPGQLVGNGYIELSGSSMATAFVTGTVANMLHANNKLTPHTVKLILMLTAVKLRQPSMLEQGNGLLNVKLAVDLAKELDVKKGEIKKKISPMWLLAADGSSDEDSDAKWGKECKDNCEEVWAGGAFAFADRVYYGDLVHPNGSRVWGESIMWADSWGNMCIVWSDAWAHSIMWADSLVRCLGPCGLTASCGPTTPRSIIPPPTPETEEGDDASSL